MDRFNLAMGYGLSFAGVMIVIIAFLMIMSAHKMREELKENFYTLASAILIGWGGGLLIRLNVLVGNYGWQDGQPLSEGAMSNIVPLGYVFIMISGFLYLKCLTYFYNKRLWKYLSLAIICFVVGAYIYI